MIVHALIILTLTRKLMSDLFNPDLLLSFDVLWVVNGLIQLLVGLRKSEKKLYQ